MKKKALFTVIIRSCLTGRAVWIYRGPSKEAARKAYWRACNKELERMRMFTERIASRAAGITRLLTNCMADKPLDAKMTPEQEAAAKELQAISRKPQETTHEFYDHIMETRRRRREDSEIRRQMRERETREKKE